MKIKVSPPTIKPYSVNGKTLADILKDILAKGPKDPNEGKRYAGSTDGTIAVSIQPSDLNYKTTPGKTPVEVIAIAEKGGTVSITSTITVPQLGSDKDLSDAAKKEWKRFLEKTTVHEKGHAASFTPLGNEIVRVVNKLNGKGTGANEKAAQVAAAKDLFAEIKKLYGGTSLADMVDDEVKKYDSQTRHGATQGAVLKTSIQ